MADFVVVNLVVSGHLREIDIELPRGRVQWAAWRRRDEHPVSYQGADEGRLLLSLDEDEAIEEREAQWITDVLSALIDIIHGPSGMTLGVVEVPASVAASREIVDAEVANLLEPLDPRWLELNSGWWPTDGPIWTALRALPSVLRSAGGSHDHGLPAALLYYKLSTSEFAFLGDSVSWALSDEGRETPTSAYDRARIEQALHNAFKALEALLGGEPSTDDRRFRQRLRQAGVDPDEQVGFRSLPREPLFDVLKRIRQTRDARAAHAGRTTARSRGISYFELMEAQYGVSAALTHAVLAVAPEAAQPPPRFQP